MLCAVDLCGRPYFVWDAEFPGEKIGTLSTEMIKEFFYAVSYACGMNLHIKMLYGGNSHHIAEAMFKALPRHWMRQFPMIPGSRMCFPPREAWHKEAEDDR